MAFPATVTSHGFQLPTTPDKFGALRESSRGVNDGDALREAMDQDGYLYLRDALDPNKVNAARREILKQLTSVEEIDPGRPLMEGIFSGRSERRSTSAVNFAKQLGHGDGVRRLVRTGEVMEFFDTFFGEQTRALDFIWLRAIRPGGATGCHYDWVYMGRGSRQLYTAWIPIGDVPYSDGPLAILENSHRLDQLIDTYGSIDVDSDGPNPYDGGTFSSNTRYQPASEPADERWVGPDPIGHAIRHRERVSPLQTEVGLGPRSKH